MKKTMVSKALREVWRWKAAGDRTVAHLPIEEALAKRIHDATEHARKMGFYETYDGSRRVPRVAETTAAYGSAAKGAARRPNGRKRLRKSA